MYSILLVVSNVDFTCSMVLLQELEEGILAQWDSSLRPIRQDLLPTQTTGLEFLHLLIHQDVYLQLLLLTHTTPTSPGTLPSLNVTTVVLVVHLTLSKELTTELVVLLQGVYVRSFIVWHWNCCILLVLTQLAECLIEEWVLE
jgi:hypothetical protein